MFVRGLILAVTTALLCPPTASGQLIRGQMVEEGTGAPVVGGFVSLVDGSGARVGGVLTLDAGRFRLTAPGPGEYRIRGERIGFDAVETSIVVLPETSQDVVLRAPTRAIQLQGIVASADRRCRVGPETGAATAVLWEEARKALDVVDLAGTAQALPVQLINWERELDPRSLLVRNEQRQVRQGFAVDPIRSRPAQELADQGYIQTGADGAVTYFGPDQSVLLSDVFQATHCFRVEPADGREETAGMVGLGFEPMDGEVPDVEGTLWLDAETAELRFLEYRYSRYPYRLDDVTNLGGRVDFERRQDGLWFVRSWRIRMPARARQGNSGLLVLEGIHEAGGEVVDARPEGGWRIPDLRGVVEGTAMDRSRNQVLSGARVYISGTSHATETGPDGWFRLEGVRPGRYGVSFSHPRADMLGFRPGLAEVEVEAAETATLTLEIPTSALTGDPCLDGLQSVLWGVVRDDVSGEPVPGATVVAGWGAWRVADSWPRVGLTGITEEVHGQADEEGRYRLCGLPGDRTRVEVVAAPEGAAEPGAAESVILQDAEVRELDIRVAAVLGAEVDPALAAGETAAGPTQRASSGPGVLTAQQIQDLNLDSNSALDIVLRMFTSLEMRGGYCLTNRRRASPSGACDSVMLVLDGVTINAPENMLSGLQGGELNRMEYIPAIEAGARYGTGSTSGVLIVSTGRR